MPAKKSTKNVQARIDDKLYEFMHDKAKKHGKTLSSLVRDVLEDVFDITDTVHDVVCERIKKDMDEGVMGYTEIDMIKDSTCDVCDKKIAKGSKAYMPIFENSNKKLIICHKCHTKDVK